MLEKVWPLSPETDHLFVGTDQYAHFTLSRENINARFRNEHIFENLKDNTARDTKANSKCLVDSNGHIMVLGFFEGHTAVIPPKLSRKGRRGERCCSQ
jgi:DNA damage-binding protein 1